MRGSDDGNYGIMTEPRFAGEAMHNALQMAGYDEPNWLICFTVMPTLRGRTG